MGEVPQDQMMLEGRLPGVINQVYYSTETKGASSCIRQPFTENEGDVFRRGECSPIPSQKGLQAQ